MSGPPGGDQSGAPPAAALAPRGFLSFLVPPPAGPGPPPPPGDPGLLRCPGAPRGLRGEWARLERELGAAKELMDPYEGWPVLAEALRVVDLFGRLKPAIRRGLGGQAVTNAWLKMYEICSETGLVLAARSPLPGGGPQSHVLRAFCNAELPGAFVCALNHFLRTWHPETGFEWVASSLFPDGGGSMLGDDYGLFGGNPDRWLMSAGMRGDVTDPADVRALAEGARARLGGVDLYTSDAGVGLGGDYLRQEELSAHVHLGQTVAGLLALRVGGALVVKTYTFALPASRALAVFCSALFESFRVAKPATSRPANSEVYLVGLGFRGVSPALRARLLDAVGAFGGGGPPPLLTPVDSFEAEDSVRALLEASREIHGEGGQVRTLRAFVALFEKYFGRGATRGPKGRETLRRKMEAFRGEVAPLAEAARAAWLEANPVRPLPPALRVRAGPGTSRG